jgi:2-polyprenyl-3-methyl-5-hydroxy-6-metoxy-1,4-benzoquinol methylase
MKEIDLEETRSIDWDDVGRRYDPNLDWEDMLLIQQTARLIQRYGGGAKRVIEVGVSTGEMTRLLLQTFDQLHILDPAQVNLDHVLKMSPKDRGRIVPHCGTVEEFKSNQPYDLAIFSFVLEHVADPIVALRALTRLVRVGGQIAIAVPNFESLNRRLGVELGMVTRLDYFQEKDELVGHRRLYSVARLRQDVAAAGNLEETALHGLLLKPLSKAQMEIWRPEVLEAFCKVGLEFPSLCVALFQMLERKT